MATNSERRKALVTGGKNLAIAIMDDLEYGYEPTDTLERNIENTLGFCKEQGLLAWLDKRLGLPTNEDRAANYRQREVVASERQAAAAERAVKLSKRAIWISIVALIVSAASCAYQRTAMLQQKAPASAPGPANTVNP